MAACEVVWLADLWRSDVALVGGKNASLGELVRTLASEGIKVPTGFATTAALNAGWSLGENAVPGSVEPGECEVCKPLLAEAADGEARTRNLPTSPAERSA